MDRILLSIPLYAHIVWAYKAMSPVLYKETIMNFDLNKFEAAFAVSLDMVRGAEDVTKRELRALSRTVLEAVHVTGRIGYVNELVGVLSPVNKKVARLFFRHFTGFHFDETANIFTKKSGKRYLDAKKESEEFLADPNNNIWSWAERHIEVSPKTFKAEKLTKYIEGQLKMAAGAGVGHAGVLKAIMAGGITVNDLIEVLTAEGADVKEIPDAPF